jgi:hypothetical protein
MSDYFLMEFKLSLLFHLVYPDTASSEFAIMSFFHQTSILETKFDYLIR